MSPSVQLNFAKIGSVLAQAVLVGVVLNVILFLIGKPAGLILDTAVIPNAGTPLRLDMVIIATVVPMVLGTLLFALLIRFSQKGDTIFKWISIAFLLFSFTSPFSIPGATTAMAIYLNLMHVVAAGAVIYFFTIRHRRESFLKPSFT